MCDYLLVLSSIITHLLVTIYSCSYLSITMFDLFFLTCGDRPNWRHDMTLMAIVSYLDSKELCQLVMINAHSSTLDDDTIASADTEVGRPGRR